MTPYISFVATSRNDNHGGSLTRRMQIFVDGLIAQCKRHSLPAELIIVEWNPPEDRRPLIKELKWPETTGPLTIRIITVPRELHRKFEHSEHLPLFQMIAKNVGIRRARAPFVVATNIDILFNNELFEFFAQKNLEEGKVYRIDRYDAMSEVPLGAPIDEQLNYCASHLVRINRRIGTMPVDIDGKPKLHEADIVNRGDGISLGTGWSDLLGKYQPYMHRGCENGAQIFLKKTDPRQVGICLDIVPGSGVRNHTFKLQIADRSGNLVACGLILGRQRIYVSLPLGVGETGEYRLNISSGGAVDPLNLTSYDAFVYSLSWTYNGIWKSRLNELDGSEFVFNMVPEFEERPPSILKMFDKKRHATPDIVNWEDDIILGNNWHAFEIKNGEYARWVDNDAELIFESKKDESRFLVLEVETGPGASYDNFVLQILDSNGTVLCSHGIKANPKRQKRFLKSQERMLRKSENRRVEVRKSEGLRKSLFSRVFSKRELIKFPFVSQSTGCTTLTLHAVLPATQKTVCPGFKTFRVFKCGWIGKSGKGPTENTHEKSSFDQLVAKRLAFESKMLKEKLLRQGLHLLHMNGCGDFTLMAKNNWNKVRAYSEMAIFSMHIDSLFIQMAAYAGLKEFILPEPMRIYHIEHETGSGWTPEGQTNLFQRIQAKGIPIISWDQFVSWVHEMAKNGPIISNNDDWGLASEKLQEAVVQNDR